MTRELLAQPESRHDWMRRLAGYLVEHRMTDDLDMIVNDIAHELYVQSGLLTVEVVSARALSQDLRARIISMMKDETQATDVVLHETIDESLVGGFIARTPDAEIDASVRSKLRALASLA
jgi:ATP synthase F1 delta subunit